MSTPMDDLVKQLDRPSIVWRERTIKYIDPSEWMDKVMAKSFKLGVTVACGANCEVKVIGEKTGVYEWEDMVEGKELPE